MSTLTAPPNVPTQVAEEERQQKVWDYYEQEVMKAIESDTWIPYTSDFFDNIREKVKQRLQSQQAGEAT